MKQAMVKEGLFADKNPFLWVLPSKHTVHTPLFRLTAMVFPLTVCSEQCVGSFCRANISIF